METFYYLFMVIMVTVLDALGYAYRVKNYTYYSKTTRDKRKWNNSISHGAQSWVKALIFLLPLATGIINVDTVAGHNGLIGELEKLWFCIYSAVCIHLLLYNIIYNIVTEVHIFYESDSSITGRIMLWLYEKVGPTTVFIFKCFIFIIPFAKAWNCR
jgi:hypothetical protein